MNFTHQSNDRDDVDDVQMHNNKTTSDGTSAPKINEISSAVRNLILNASRNASKYAYDMKKRPMKKRPSSSYVATLTSTSCRALEKESAVIKVDEASLSADERTRRNRQSRERLRNSRLRKKAYVQELKRTLTELVSARDVAEVEKRYAKQRELEEREIRYRVMEEFLKLRSRGSDPNLLPRWSAILEDGFTFTLPKTQHNGVVFSQLRRHDSFSSVAAVVIPDPDPQPELFVDPTLQVLHGATECYDDASKLEAFLQDLTKTSNIFQSYNCERKKFLMDDVNTTLQWTWTCNRLGEVSFEESQHIISLFFTFFTNFCFSFLE